MLWTKIGIIQAHLYNIPNWVEPRLYNILHFKLISLIINKLKDICYFLYVRIFGLLCVHLNRFFSRKTFFIFLMFYFESWKLKSEETQGNQNKYLIKPQMITFILFAWHVGLGGYWKGQRCGPKCRNCGFVFNKIRLILICDPQIFLFHPQGFEDVSVSTNFIQIILLILLILILYKIQGAQWIFCCPKFIMWMNFVAK
jgi:hypothetical protein